MNRRPTQVANFRNKILDLIEQNKNIAAIAIYRKGPSYKDMCNSDKPLTLENWYSKEEIKILKEKKSYDG